MEAQQEINLNGLDTLINQKQHALTLTSQYFSPIALEDVIYKDEALPELGKVRQLIPKSIQEIEDYYHQDFKLVKNSNLQIHYPLHIAARDGNCDEIIRLVNDGFGYDINQTDARSITPLHVAALFGQIDAVKTLITLGATVDIKGYEQHTPLHFALLKNHYDIATTLILEGGACPLQEDDMGINGFTLLLDDIPNLLQNAGDDSKAKAKLDSAMNLIDVMIHHSNGPLLFNDISEHQNEIYLTPYPLETILQFIASYSPSVEYANKLLQLIEQAKTIDPSGQGYIVAKDLLHQFPTGGIYKINLTDDKKVWFVSEGHSGILTTALASLSLKEFIHSADFDHADPVKADVFASLQEIYNHAKDFTLFSSTQETANTATMLYNEGKTVLLPSGWDGHFIDVILSKPQLMYVVANSGDRYHGEAPDYEPDPAGINFYQIYEPEKISTQFMYNILNNTDKTTLEFENAYEYGVFERIEEISRDDQQFGNCGWESHRNAVEGLIYIELLNRNIAPEQAKLLASEYYQEWDNFHGHFVIDRYLESSPVLPVEALIDIFNQIHFKENYSDIDHQYAQKIAQALFSPHYLEEFQSWLQEKEDIELADKLMLNILKVEHEMDIQCIMNEELSCKNVVTSAQEVSNPNLSINSIVIEPLLTPITIIQETI
ncbi:MAG: ankyrin repeat domain-containing protein [Proteobacteria bacterium]|nr:ankyrin repeat domain-containing protein [Pseudomonadota bacterium]